MTWAHASAHTLPQLAAMISANAAESAAVLSDAVIAACAPHGKKAAELANAEIRRRARRP